MQTWQKTLQSLSKKLSSTRTKLVLALMAPVFMHTVSMSQALFKNEIGPGKRRAFFVTCSFPILVSCRAVARRRELGEDSDKTVI